MRDVPRTIAALFALLCAGACSADLGSRNVFDPDQPASLQAPATLRGRVRAEEQGPARDATLTLDGPDTRSVRVGADGIFEVRGLTPGDYDLTVTQPGYLPLELTGLHLSLGEIVDRGDLLLVMRRVTVSGVAKLEGAESSEGIAVVLSARSAATPQALRPAQSGDGDTGASAAPPRSYGTLTDADGNWSFPGVPVGTYRVTATLPDHTRFCRDLVEISDDAGELRVDTVMRLVSASAVLRVVDADGGVLRATDRPQVGLDILAFGAVDVRLALDPETLAAKPFAPFTSARVDGFSIAAEGEADGPRTVYAQLRDTCDLESPVFSATVLYDTTAPSVHVLRLDGGAGFLRDPGGVAVLDIVADDALSGLDRLFLTLGGQPIDAGNGRDFVNQVVLGLGADDGEKEIVVVVRDAAGNDSAPARVSAIKDTLAPVPGTIPLQVDEADGGRVVDPAVHLSLDFDGEPTELALRNRPGTAAGPWQPYDANVDWRLDGGPDGPRNVYARVRDAAGNTTDEIAVAVVLDRSGEVRGLVRLEGAGAPGAVALSLGELSSAPGADGRFTFAAVPPGVYTLRATASGHAPLSVGVAVEAGWDPLESTCRHASLSIL